MKVAFLCPGQGAQKPGMGAGFAGSADAADVFACGSDILGLDLARLAVQGDKNQVDDPVNAQYLTFSVALAAARELMGAGVKPAAIAGFSLGEISALAASEALSLEDAYRLLSVRANAMSRCCERHPGAMAALLGGRSEEAESLCAQVNDRGTVVVANYNCPGQTVVSGDVAAVEDAMDAWSARGRVFRAVKLNTAGAFHSPLMAEAAAEVRSACAGFVFSRPRVPVICNTDAGPFSAAEAAKRLGDQVERPVLFEQSVRALDAHGVNAFVETGFGTVLSGLVKRIGRTLDAKPAIMHAGSLEEAAACAEQLASA